MVLTTLHIRLAIVLVSIFTWNTSCKKIEIPLLVNGSKMYASNPDNNCIQFANPEWIDEITYFDTTVENYNSVVLRAFLKNTCNDTLAVGMVATSLATSAIQWYFKDEDGFDSILTKSDSFHVLVPGDSIYMYLTELKAEYVNKVDSIKIYVPYMLKDQFLNKMVMIDGHNITYRE